MGYDMVDCGCLVLLIVLIISIITVVAGVAVAIWEEEKSARRKKRDSI